MRPKNADASAATKLRGGGLRGNGCGSARTAPSANSPPSRRGREMCRGLLRKGSIGRLVESVRQGGHRIRIARRYAKRNFIFCRSASTYRDECHRRDDIDRANANRRFCFRSKRGAIPRSSRAITARSSRRNESKSGSKLDRQTRTSSNREVPGRTVTTNRLTVFFAMVA